MPHNKEWKEPTTWATSRNSCNRQTLKVLEKRSKVKAFHTRYRALGLELIPVYRQSARRWPKVIHPPDLRLPWASLSLGRYQVYCLVTEGPRCEQLARGWYAALPRVGFEPTTCWSQVQRSTHCATAPGAGTPLIKGWSCPSTNTVNATYKLEDISWRPVTSTACCDLDLWPPKSNQVISTGQWQYSVRFIEIAQVIHEI